MTVDKIANHQTCVMPNTHSRTEQIRQFIVAHVEKHPHDIAKLTAEEFGITRQAVNRHLDRLISDNVLAFDGKTRNRAYNLVPLVQWTKYYELNDLLAEDIVWRTDIQPSLSPLSENALDIWNYAFTEMFNNVIDHSEGRLAQVTLCRNAAFTKMSIYDDGIGIFRKIQSKLDLIDEHHAVLELSKGKLSTDPANHTGEGIFFASRMFDEFVILSGRIYFSHQFSAIEDVILESGEPEDGTMVKMKLNNDSARTLKMVFDQFSDDEFAFTKTIVPVRLAQYGDEKLISRSQAKRLLARMDRFKTVSLDFTGVESIGQAFADEIFRVFATSHPETELKATKANSAVERMIQRVRLSN